LHFAWETRQKEGKNEAAEEAWSTILSIFISVSSPGITSNNNSNNNGNGKDNNTAGNNKHGAKIIRNSFV